MVAKYSVAPVRARLAELCPGVELMENLRFNPGEESDDPAFGASLVEGFDYYINEAFSASHRAHASIMIPPTVAARARRARTCSARSRPSCRSVHVA